MKLEIIRSGLQEGADLAALKAAKSIGLRTASWMPKGFLSHSGYHPEYAELYNAQETVSETYPERTLLNVRDSDGTVRLATQWDSNGERLTLKYIKQESRPHEDVCFITNNKRPIDIAKWICDNGISTLNVAGNSLRTSPNIEKLALPFLLEVFKLVKEIELGKLV